MPEVLELPVLTGQLTAAEAEAQRAEAWRQYAELSVSHTPVTTERCKEIAKLCLGGTQIAEAA